MTPTPRAWLASVVHAAEAFQVELNGRFSLHRVRDLAVYLRTSSTLWAIFVLIASAVPCLVTPIVLDFGRLEQPSTGIDANTTFFGREYVVWWVFSFLAAAQGGHFVSLLGLTVVQLALVSTVAAAGSTAATYALASWIGFPVPFTIVMDAPVWVTLLSVLVILTWLRRLRSTSDVKPQLVSLLKVWGCQCCLVSIYPAYFYIFTSLSQSAQLPFACLLPIIKVLVRNWLSRALEHLRDEMSEVVLLNADIFSSLFVAYCMGTVPSLWATAGLMAIDAIQIIIAARDISAYLRTIETQRALLEASSLGSPKDLCEVSTREIDQPPPTSDWQAKRTVLNQADAIIARHFAPSAVLVAKRTRSIAYSGESAPSGSTGLDSTPAHLLRKVLPTALHGFGPNELDGNAEKEDIGHQLPRRGIRSRTSTTMLPPLEQQFVETVGRLLFYTEFILLLNYVEVVIPIVYSISLSAAYYLPNQPYYTSLASLDAQALQDKALTVFVYGLLEFVSLAVVCWVFAVRLRYSAVGQLAFLLQKQWQGVQVKLVFWVLYASQTSLKHFGYDYTFQFAWLQETPP